ncbi:YebC/PmpR family DNA-binding transcriptional regulator [Candidatus Microgenomates bacterium]|nr:YebC/PmpR family DNA-binding transcriptional regulator [Candidatus Microgenomates bacterium]
MSGHSKWASIKRKKGAMDARRGQIFTKMANAVAVAARDGTDPQTNFKLRLAIDKAKAANVPAANIAKAIARGSGKSGVALESVQYEGYGPGGVALIVEAATGNKNRTGATIRSIFTKHGGRLAEPGSVLYQFAQRGVIVLEPDALEAAELAAIDVGAQDVEEDETTLTVYTAAQDLGKVRNGLSDAGYQVESAELSYVPRQTVPVSDPETARKVIGLMEDLENLDDVTATSSNFDIPAEILETTTS